MKNKLLIVVLLLVVQSVLAVGPEDKILSVEKSYISVQVADVDAFIYTVPVEFLQNMLQTPRVLDRNLLSLLDFETVYQHLKQQNLLQQEPFKSVTINNQFDEARLARFAEQLGYDLAAFRKQVEKIEYRKEYNRVLLSYFRQQLSPQDAEELAFEHYLINKDKYRQPERRELMLIQLDKENYSQVQAEDILKQLKQDLSESFFEQTAVEKSNDVTAESNRGRLGLFTKRQFNLPFAEEIFLQPEPGLIDFLYQNDKSFFIVRVIDILPPSVKPFAEVKKNMITEVTGNIAKQKYQNIIDSEQGKIVPNPEAAKEIFGDRYKFLLTKPEQPTEKE